MKGLKISRHGNKYPNVDQNIRHKSAFSMDPTPEQSMVVFAGFLQHGNAQSLEEQSRILRVVEDALITTPIRSNPRCLCLGCYQKIGFSQE
jgi:hypothetical protein